MVDDKKPLPPKLRPRPPANSVDVTDKYLGATFVFFGEHIHQQRLAGLERDRKLIDALSQADRTVFDALAGEQQERVVTALRWHPELTVQQILDEINNASPARPTQT